MKLLRNSHFIFSFLLTIGGCSGVEEGNLPAEPCAAGYFDEATLLCWQDPPIDEKLTQEAAMNHCKDLELDGSINWRLPDIEELRSLVRGCPDSHSEGACSISVTSSYDAGTDPYCSGCDDQDSEDTDDCYFPEELQGACEPEVDNNWINAYWSSTKIDDTFSWYINFGSAYVHSFSNWWEMGALCVR